MEEQVENWNQLSVEEQENIMYEQWVDAWQSFSPGNPGILDTTKKAFSLPSQSVYSQSLPTPNTRPYSSDDWISNGGGKNWDMFGRPKSIELIPSIEEELSSQNLYKTELCRSWKDFGTCRYGHKCQFAHGEHELRILMRHPKYKTEHCKTYTLSGYCPYGERCRFIHPESPQAGSFPGARNKAWSKSWSPQGLNVLTSIPTFIPKNQQQNYNVSSSLGDFSGRESFSTLSTPSPDSSFVIPREDEGEVDDQIAEGRSRLAIFQTFSQT